MNMEKSAAIDLVLAALAVSKQELLDNIVFQIHYKHILCCYFMFML